MTIGKDQVAAAQDLQFEYVDVPEWHDQARMQEFSADGKAIFGAWGKSQDENADARAVIGFAARVVALSLSNEDGTLVYTDFDEGVAALLPKNPKVLDRLSDVALKLSAMLPDAVEQIADELPNEVSGSAS